MSRGHGDFLLRRFKRLPSNSPLKEEFEIGRNKASALVRSSKRRYFKGELENNRFDTAKTWEIANQIRGAKKKKDIQSMR